MIPLPNLDDRRWADLVDEARALLPVHAPAWTDHNVSDPGITLIELFAWLTEQDLYRLNRVTERERRKFLELIGARLEPPRAARSVLVFRLPPNEAEAVHLPAGTEFEVGEGALAMRTRYPVRVGQAALAALQLQEGPAYRVLHTSAADGWLPFGDDATPDATLYLGFDRPLPTGRRTSLYFVAPDRVRAPAQRPRPLHSRAARRQQRAHHSVELAWEYYTDEGEWAPIRVVDGTRAWTRSGQLWLDRPLRRFGAARVGSVAEGLYYVRCRLVRGRFDAPPRGVSLLAHAVEVEQAQAVPGASASEGVPIGEGTGEPHQRLALPSAPVLPGSLRVYSTAGGDVHEWRLRADLAASSAADRDLVLDPTSGELHFGDGFRARAPAEGERFFAAYAATAAQAGLADPTTRVTLRESVHNRSLALPNGARRLSVRMPVSAVGGAAAETLAEALERAAFERERTSRAVTLTDHELIAQATPGVEIARVHAVANHHPAFDCVDAPGTVTVVVVPSLPRRRPSPSAGLVARVRAELTARRLLGSRCEVVGPTYLEVAVDARVRVLAGQSVERVRRAIVRALDRFLDPLAGGPDGSGWPFGRDVYRAEILQLIDEVPGVDHVIDLSLGACGATCGNVCLKPTWLTTPGAHRVEVL